MLNRQTANCSCRPLQALAAAAAVEVKVGVERLPLPLKEPRIPRAENWTRPMGISSDPACESNGKARERNGLSRDPCRWSRIRLLRSNCCRRADARICIRIRPVCKLRAEIHGTPKETTF